MQEVHVKVQTQSIHWDIGKNLSSFKYSIKVADHGSPNQQLFDHDHVDFSSMHILPF